MAQNWDLCVFLDVFHEGIGTSWDDQVDVGVLFEKVCDLSSGADELDAVVRNVCFVLQDVVDDAGHCLEGVEGLLASLENCSVAGLDGQGGDIGDDLRPTLKYDEQDANRASEPVEV